jgi:hypothetical protein
MLVKYSIHYFAEVAAGGDSSCGNVDVESFNELILI